MRTITRLGTGSRAALFGLALTAGGCAATGPRSGEPTTPTRRAATAAPGGEAAARDTTSATNATPMTVSPEASSSAPASLEPSTSGSATRTASPSSALSSTVTPSAPTAADGSPIPRVKLANIGLHIGGGPNDPATKAPFERRIAERFEAFERCYGKVAKPGAHGTFGVDLLIDKAGGHAQVSGARTGLPGDEFHDCVAHVFETVVFDPPKHGTTKISYALEFTPE